VDGVKIVDRPSPNFDVRTTPVWFVVLHYTGMKDAETALKRLIDPAPKAGDYPGPWQAPDIDPATPLSRVSAHYVVGEDGTVFRVVDEEHRAWHAGKGSWAGQTDLNSCAIGIEIANGGHDYGLPPYPEAQIAAVIALLGDILSRRGLLPESVIGHSDLAPARKDDPGEHFPWKRLADAGVSIWPDADGVARIVCKRGDRGEAVHHLHAALAAFGYEAPEDESAKAARFTETTEAIVRAFQRRFEPDACDGVVRDSTMMKLEALVEMIEDGEAG
jgi:N-acetylmuramoyl-L-alanine amidase